MRIRDNSRSSFNEETLCPDKVDVSYRMLNPPEPNRTNIPVKCHLGYNRPMSRDNGSIERSI